MPYVQRDSTGQVVAIFAQPGPGHDELLPAGHPELAALAGASEFAHLDADLIRVIEDVVDVLIDRGLLRLTDLPPDAQRKLLARKGARARLREGLDLLSPNGVI
ncbi:MAG: hypothetical protein PHW25_11800 [Zoogloea sp.]|uniref:hypothetical protein n=1 Tax=Zoogloea sp. TaxID=49181 RepID=UPI002625C3C2|nr:hypothetical protein [Zoogloea sp.]MDD3327755.1 hypothetical protein [Zoogloea sp.]